MKRTGFKPKPRKPLKRTPLKAKTALKAAGVKKRRTRSPMQKLKDQLWEECKRITRARYQTFDGTWRCYTCDARLELPKLCQTGHFIPSSVCSVELRYDLDNLRIQCYACNINKSGNWVEYEKRLRKDKGDDFPERLKARNESTKGLSYREDWYAAYLKNYKEIER
jgi:hypothetical protein